MNNPDTHPNAHWPWWKIAGSTLLGFSIFGAILALIPPVRTLTFILGLSSVVIAVPIGIWNWKSYSWLSRLLFSFLWTIQLLGIGIKTWIYNLPEIWVYPLSLIYVLAWILPGLIPKFSEILWREQTAPQTKIGKYILGAAISLAPVAGAVGASLGIFTSRFNGLGKTYLIAGPLFITLAIAISFFFSHQIWSDLPWTQTDKF